MPIEIDFVCQSSMGRSEGGLETWAYQFVPGLLRLYPEARVRFYGARPVERSDVTAELLNEAGANRDRLDVTFFPISPGRVPQILSMIRQFVARKSREETAATVVITAGTFLELLMVLISRRYRKAFKVVWLRTIWVDQKTYRIPRLIRPLVRWIEASILGRGDLILANGSDIAERYGRYGLTVRVIRNAVDLARWQAPPPAIGAPLHVAFVGRLAIDKGIREFVALADRLGSAAGKNRYVFDVYGHIGQEDLVREAAERGVLKWHGPVDNADLPAVLAGVDVCVALTKSDPALGGGGTSNSMMEQLAAGRVMLAWDNPIFRQWLNEDNSYLVPQGDVGGLARQLELIRAHPETARIKAELGRRAVSDCGIDAMMNRFGSEMQASLPQNAYRPLAEAEGPARPIAER